MTYATKLRIFSGPLLSCEETLVPSGRLGDWPMIPGQISK